MAVIARDQITLSWQLDIKQTIYYYKKQSSTSAAPAKPTAYPPTGWSTTEPAYSTGETSTLYVTVCTIFSDNTYEYSDVTVSSSFEAAKAAYNKAVAAEGVANNAITAANGKNKIFYQDAAPASGMSEGDLWFDTDGGNAIYEYKKVSSNPVSYSWTLRQFGTGSIAAGSITANEINVANLAAITAYLGNAVIGGSGNTSGTLTVKNASGNTIGTWDNNGINATGTLTSKSSNDVYKTTISGGYAYFYYNDTIAGKIETSRDSYTIPPVSGYPETTISYNIVDFKGGSTSSLASEMSLIPRNVSSGETYLVLRNVANYFPDELQDIARQVLPDIVLSGKHARFSCDTINLSGSFIANHIGTSTAIISNTCQVSGTLTCNNSIILANTKYIWFKNASGNDRLMAGTNNLNQTFFGQGSYTESEGQTYFRGNEVHLDAKTTLTVTAGSGVTLPAATTVTMSTGTGTINTTYCNSGTITFRKRGNVVQVEGTVNLKAALTSRQQVATIPAGYRPCSTTYGYIAGSSIIVVYNTGGALQMDATSAGNKWFSYCYVVA